MRGTLPGQLPPSASPVADRDAFKDLAMTQQTERAAAPQIYRISCDDGRRFVIYNAHEIGNPGDHEADKWYFRPYPVPVGLDCGQPFDSAEAAERAARALES
jgi:hypothetical protein